jgi:cyclin B
MLIASKYEEIYAPEIRDFVYITDKAYNKEDIMRMENRILMKLKFDVLSVSPYRLLERLVLQCGNDLKLFYLSQFILELSLVEYTMWKYIPSVKACSSVFIARKILKLVPTWPKVLENTWEYTEVTLRMCVKDLCSILDMSSKCTLRAIKNKFSNPRFMEVSKLPIFNN